jgi:hypothetical protein
VFESTRPHFSTAIFGFEACVFSCATVACLFNVAFSINIHFALRWKLDPLPFLGSKRGVLYPIQAILSTFSDLKVCEFFSQKRENNVVIDGGTES